jgi:hypothetical protein
MALFAESQMSSYKKASAVAECEQLQIMDPPMCKD